MYDLTRELSSIKEKSLGESTHQREYSYNELIIIHDNIIKIVF